LAQQTPSKHRDDDSSNRLQMTQTFAKVIQLRREGLEVAEFSDEALIAGCATGDRASRAALFERHVGGVHRFIARLSCADADAVDDLIQATFIEAFSSAAKFRGGSQVKTWLCGIALNVTRNYARSEIRRKQAMGNATRAACIDVSWSGQVTGYDAVQRQQMEKLTAALPSLSEELRSVFVMCDMEGLKGVEVAALLGIPEGTVWRRLHDARAKLRTAISDGGGR
jgi:RNA polymerase sigma-70 factor, ECF subfamily